MVKNKGITACWFLIKTLHTLYNDNMRLFKRTIIVSLMALFFIMMGGLNAQAIKLEDLKPLTEVEPIPLKEFENLTKTVKEMPYDDNFLEYQIDLPKDFKPSTSKLNVYQSAENVSQRVLGVVSRHAGPPIGYVRSSFVLEALELTYEISARNWFINYIISNGLSLEQVGQGTDNSIEAIYIEVEDDVTYIVRIKAVKNGPRMVMARYYLPQELYKQDRVLQAQVIDSFELMNTETTTVENRKLYGFLDQSYIKYLASWELDAPYIRSIDRMHARVFRNVKGDRLDGQIDVYLSKKDGKKTRSEEIKTYREKLIFKGYDLNGFIEKANFKYHRDMRFGITEVYSLKSQNQQFLDYEVWFTFLENKDYYYFVVMYTPERKVSFAPWARNIEAYKVLLKNLSRNTEEKNFMKITQ